MRILAFLSALLRLSMFTFWIPFFIANNEKLDLVIKNKLDLIKWNINEVITNFATFLEDRPDILNLKVLPMEIPSFQQSLVGIEHLQCSVRLTR